MPATEEDELRRTFAEIEIAVQNIVVRMPIKHEVRMSHPDNN